jgi:hypothetical protein
MTTPTNFSAALNNSDVPVTELISWLKSANVPLYATLTFKEVEQLHHYALIPEERRSKIVYQTIRQLNETNYIGVTTQGIVKRAFFEG